MRLLHAVPLGILWLSLPLSSAQAESALVPYSDFAIRTGMPPAPFRAAWAAPDARSSPGAAEPGHGPMSAAETATVQRHLGPVILDIPRGYLTQLDGYVRPFDYVVLWASLPDMSVPDVKAATSARLENRVIIKLSFGEYHIPDAEWKATRLDGSTLKASVGEIYKVYSTKLFPGDTIIISEMNHEVEVECGIRGNFLPFPHCEVRKHIISGIYLDYRYEREQLGGDITKVREVDKKVESFILDLIHTNAPGR